VVNLYCIPTRGQVSVFATQHRLHVVRVSEVVARRFATERLIERIAESRLPTNHGVFTAIGYRRKFDHPTECLALSYGESAAPPMWLCFRDASRATLWDPLAADAAATSTKRWHRLSNADAAFSSTSGVPPTSLQRSVDASWIRVLRSDWRQLWAGGCGSRWCRGRWPLIMLSAHHQRACHPRGSQRP